MAYTFEFNEHSELSCILSNAYRYIADRDKAYSCTANIWNIVGTLNGIRKIDGKEIALSRLVNSMTNKSLWGGMSTKGLTDDSCEIDFTVEINGKKYDIKEDIAILYPLDMSIPFLPASISYNYKYNGEYSTKDFVKAYADLVDRFKKYKNSDAYPILNYGINNLKIQKTAIMEMLLNGTGYTAITYAVATSLGMVSLIIHNERILDKISCVNTIKDIVTVPDIDEGIAVRFRPEEMRAVYMISLWAYQHYNDAPKPLLSGLRGSFEDPTEFERYKAAMIAIYKKFSVGLHLKIKDKTLSLKYSTGLSRLSDDEKEALKKDSFLTLQIVEELKAEPMRESIKPHDQSMYLTGLEVDLNKSAFLASQKLSKLKKRPNDIRYAQFSNSSISDGWVFLILCREGYIGKKEESGDCDDDQAEISVEVSGTELREQPIFNKSFYNVLESNDDIENIIKGMTSSVFEGAAFFYYLKDSIYEVAFQDAVSIEVIKLLKSSANNEDIIVRMQKDIDSKDKVITKLKSAKAKMNNSGANDGSLKDKDEQLKAKQDEVDNLKDKLKKNAADLVDLSDKLRELQETRKVEQTSFETYKDDSLKEISDLRNQIEQLETQLRHYRIMLSRYTGKI